MNVNYAKFQKNNFKGITLNKIEKLSHIKGARGSQDLQSLTLIMAPCNTNIVVSLDKQG